MKSLTMISLIMKRIGNWKEKSLCTKSLGQRSSVQCAEDYPAPQTEATAFERRLQAVAEEGALM